MLARHNQVGILGASEINEVLQNCQTAHLGCWAHGEGYIVPITYVWADGWLYGHTHEGKKIEMMRVNPKVCCQVEQMRDLLTWKSVIVWGKYQELEGDRAAQAMRLMVEKLGGQLSSLEMDFAAMLDKAILFGIEISKSTGRWEGSHEF